jgi:DNA-binding transcriptional LysR family regulator
MPKPVSYDARIGGQLRLRDLHILLAVAQHGTMARAAAQLGISQPAVSAAIAGLEQTLGIRLMERSRRGAEPTAHGAALLRSATAAFDELRQGLRQIEFLSDPNAGEVRIGCPESIASGILGPIVKRMAERRPRIRLIVEQALTQPLFPQLDNRQVDLILTRWGPLLGERDLGRAFDVEILFNDRIRLATGKRSPWARRRRIGLADLGEARWITVAGNDIGGAALANAFRACGLAPPPIAVTTYSIHLRYSLAASAGFIAAIPESVLRFNPQGLHELPIDLPAPPWPVALVRAKHRAANPAADRFVECARHVARTFAASAPPP